MTDVILHVYPQGDQIRHDLEHGAACVCGPTMQPVQAVDGSVHFALVHHALDGRRFYGGQR